MPGLRGGHQEMWDTAFGALVLQDEQVLGTDVLRHGEHMRVRTGCCVRETRWEGGRSFDGRNGGAVGGCGC